MKRWDARAARAGLRARGLAGDEIEAWLNLHKRGRFAAQYMRDRDGRPWRPRPYQADSLESYALRKVHCDGRDVGKTAEIEIVALWAMVACPDTEMLIATQCENHLFPLMSRLARRFQTTPDFAPSLVEFRRTPSWFLRFSNGFMLWGRIAGPRGVNFQGMHVAWQIVDEAQEMTETAWGELYQALNGGGRRWVYGVPNGLRNAFHRMTRMQDAEQYNWPSSLNPEFTPEKDAELALLYGGRDSPGYIHRVLGRHGEPAHAAFNLDDYLACVRDGVDFHDVALGEGDAFSAPERVPRGAYYLGCDLGYARDPSEFVVYRAEGPDLINVLRVHLHGVNYARQQAIIGQLDAAYTFRGIGIDCGNSGRAVAHALMAQGDRWCAIVRAYEFGGTIDLEPLPDGAPARRRIKPLMTELIQRRMADRTIVFPPLADRESQYASHTYRVTANGEIVYEKGNDHLIDADRCAVLRHYEDTRDPLQSMAIPPRIEGF
ncbi:MAG TPA: hypothetical protein P5318_05910 [Candidatus Hydrogenedentes bacterium]|nr:hypothetical protein [Candidatus Hydrogenedentota bacterium]HRT19645.1 hypothetical protein [Candidatus Hydrogenedentota bacterium]HRT64419.1 hypothetical protein [Candidatus Hydrogenedentota bacterium]